MRYWTAAWIAAVNFGSALEVTTPWGAASSTSPRVTTWPSVSSTAYPATVESE